jgi:hypothetical protein
VKKLETNKEVIVRLAIIDRFMRDAVLLEMQQPAVEKTIQALWSLIADWAWEIAEIQHGKKATQKHVEKIIDDRIALVPQCICPECAAAFNK